MKLKWSIALATLLFTGQVFAGACNSNACTAPIKTLYVHGGNGNIYVAADADMSLLDCTLDQGQFLVLEDSNVRHKEIYSMLLAARIAKQDVLVRIVNGSANCEIMYTLLKD